MYIYIYMYPFFLIFKTFRRIRFTDSNSSALTVDLFCRKNWSYSFSIFFFLQSQPIENRGYRWRSWSIIDTEERKRVIGTAVGGSLETNVKVFFGRDSHSRRCAPLESTPTRRILSESFTFWRRKRASTFTATSETNIPVIFLRAENFRVVFDISASIILLLFIVCR